MRAELFTDAKALAALETEWWDLFRRTPSATPFSSPAWLLPWWDAFTPGDLFTVAVRHEGRLAGLAPLYIETGSHGRRILPLGIGISDFTDILLDPDHAGPAGEAITAALDDGDRRWDCWSAEEAHPAATILGLGEPRGWTSTVSAQSACPVLPLPSPFTAAAAGIPHHKQRTWRLAANRTARRAGSLATATAATLADDLAHLFRLHAARWEDKGESGVLAPEPVQHFHAAAVPRLFAAGMLRLTTLRIAGEVAGVYYGLRHGDWSMAYLTGFDPRFAFESPGTVLMGAAIEEAAAEGAREFHFLRGQEGYKYEWGATDRWNSCRQFTVSR